MQISEHDWKIFRNKIPDWQERYMERLAADYITLLQSEKKASAKFWELEKRIKQDKKSPGVLIDMRRSTAINNIVNMVLDEVSILMYSVCKYLMASEEGSVSDIAVTTVSTSAPVNAFCISSNCRYKAFTVCTSGYMVSFLPTTQMRL